MASLSLRFAVLWTGQTAAMFGVGLSAFVVGVSLLQGGEGVSAYTRLVAVTAMPAALLGPLAGALSERWPPIRALALGLLLPGVLSVLLAAVLLGDGPTWLLYALPGLASGFAVLHWPAYVKATTGMMPDQVGRTAGLMQLGIVAQRVGAPGGAAALLGWWSAPSVLLLDGALALLGGLSLLALPRWSPPKATTGLSFWDGVRFILRRPGLRIFLLCVGGSYAFGAVLVALGLPLLIALGGVRAAGGALAVAGLGMVAGTLLAAAWAPRRTVRPALLLDALSAVFLSAMGLVPTVTWVGGCALGFLLAYGLHAGLAQALWQVRVPLALQARVFSIRTVALFGALPLVYLAVGPLADGLTGQLTGGPVVALLGESPAIGARVVLVLAGLGKLLSLGLGWLHPALRGLEEDVPALR